MTTTPQHSTVYYVIRGFVRYLVVPGAMVALALAFFWVMNNTIAALILAAVLWTIVIVQVRRDMRKASF